MKILATGFAPFGGQMINPSWEAVKALENVNIDAQVRCVCLPVEWKAGPETLGKEIEAFLPDCVLMCGQAGGRAKISLERVAFNLCDCKAPDNVGLLLQGEPIVPHAPSALAATYPFAAMRAALEKAGLPVEYSWDAGRYICNEVLYTALLLARQEYPGMRAGFVHLPFLPGQREGAPCMALEEQKRAVRTLVCAIAQNFSA